MRVARSHPFLGWLRLDGHTYSRTLDQSLRERDRALELERNHTGHAEGLSNGSGPASSQTLYVRILTDNRSKIAVLSFKPSQIACLVRSTAWWVVCCRNNLTLILNVRSSRRCWMND